MVLRILMLILFRTLYVRGTDPRLMVSDVATDESLEISYYCPKDGVTSTNTSLYPCLIFSSDKLSWMDALSFCETTGGTLVKIENDQQLAHINTYQKDRYTWFGMNDLDTENTFVWTDGLPVTWYKWLTDQPNGGTTQNCTAVYSDFKWQDKECENQYYYICRLTTEREPVDSIVADITSTITDAVKFETPDTAKFIELLSRLNVVDESLCLLHCHYSSQCVTMAYGKGKTPFNCLLYRKSRVGYAPLWKGWNMYSVVA